MHISFADIYVCVSNLRCILRGQVANFSVCCIHVALKLMYLWKCCCFLFHHLRLMSWEFCCRLCLTSTCMYHFDKVTAGISNWAKTSVGKQLKFVQLFSGGIKPWTCKKSLKHICDCHKVIQQTIDIHFAV